MPAETAATATFVWWLAASILFGAVGLAAFVYGKKPGEYRPRASGVLLMVYPYFTTNTLALFAVGIALSSALY